MANSEIIADDPKPKENQDCHDLNQSSRPLFDLTPILRTPLEIGEIRLCAHTESAEGDPEKFRSHQGSQILAFATKSGDLILLKTRNDESPVIKKVPWYLDPEKAIVALSFDPSGTWLLVVGADASFSLVPVITIITGTSSGVVSRHGWATGDITSFPSLVKEFNSLHPTCAAWWENAQWGPVAVLGGDHGELVFIDLATGTVVGTANVVGAVKSLYLCHDNSLETVFLLITNANREQWKLVLEQKKYGYCWPLDRGDVGGSVGDLGFGSYGGSGGGNNGRRGGSPSIPTRSRLQGLKQLSVEKLSIIKQKLAESRKGGTIGVPTSSSSGGLRLRDAIGDDGTSQKKLDSKSSSGYPGQSNLIRNLSLVPEKLGHFLGDTFISLQNFRSHPVLSGYYAPSSIFTVHKMSLEVVPLYIHKLPPQCQEILLTDRFIFITNQSSQVLTVVSCQLSESSLEGNNEYNTESIVQNFKFPEGERVLAMFKKTAPKGTHRREEQGLRGGGTFRGGNRHNSAGVLLGKKGNRLNPGISHGDLINLNESLERNVGGSVGGIRKSNSMGQAGSSSLSSAQTLENIAVRGRSLETKGTDTCIAVTTCGAYELQLRQCPTELFLDLALKKGELEEAERIAQVFGLNLQHLLEVAGDLELASKSFTQAISFYKLSRCRHLKSVLKFAAGGHSVELLSFIETVFGSSSGSGGGADLSPLERIHLSNLAVMAHVERVLRSAAATLPSSSSASTSLGSSCSLDESGYYGKGSKRKYAPSLLGKFLQFLHDNQHYDEELAVSVVGQTALWEPLKFLCTQRGLHREALSRLSSFLKSVGADGLKGHEGFSNKQGTPSNAISPVAATLLDSGLWDCLSDPALLQPLLEKPELANIHMNFVNTFLPVLSVSSLQKLAVLYDPSSPVFYPCLQRMFLELHKSQQIGVSTSGGDNLDDSTASSHPVGDMIEMFVKIMLHLCQKRIGSFPQYFSELMGWNGPRAMGSNEGEERQECKSHKDDLTKEKIQDHPLAAGYAHAALVWNHGILTWGNAARGCLGHGPTMSSYSFPQDVSSFPSLGIEVLSVSCGRQHTLALTTNGVYAWGSAQFGQIGIGMSCGQAPYPSLVESLWQEHIVEVSAGQYHSMALTEDGRVYTWGWGVYGQLGHGDVEDCVVPTVVRALIGKVKVKRICGGHCHSLALTDEGILMAWGSSVFGQLGHGAVGKSSLPVQVPLPEPVTMVTTGYFHNLAVGISNQLYTWGSSPQVLRLQAQAQKKARLILNQQLQQQQHPISPEKEKINGKKFPTKFHVTDQTGDQVQPEIKTNTAETDLQMPPPCALGNAGEETAPPGGEVVRGEVETPQAVPAVEGESQAHLLPSVVDTSLVLGPITQISCGCHHSALLTTDGTVYTWGRSLDGQVGNGTRREAPIPAPLMSPPPVPPPALPPPNTSTTLPILTRLRASHIACGCEFTLALENSSGKLWAWGSNSLAQLGKDLENDTRSAIEGKVVMLKTTKRVIKLPHGAQNSSDLPYLVPWLPPKLPGSSSNENLGKFKSSFLMGVPRGIEEVPPYGPLTLHRILEFFHKHYNTQHLLSSCLEMENYQAAAKIVALESHFHQALAYQLKALYLASKNNKTSDRKEKKGKPSMSSSVKVSREDGSITRVEEEEEEIGEEDLVKVGMEVAYCSSRRCETHSFAIQGGAEEMSEVGGDSPAVSSPACPCIQEEEEGKDNEPSIGLVSTPVTGENEMGISVGVSEKVRDLTFVETKIINNQEQTESKLIESSGTIFVQPDAEEKKDSTKSELLFLRKTFDLEKLESSGGGNISRKANILSDVKGVEGVSGSNDWEGSQKLNVLKPEEELACRASVVVEHYASLLEEEGHLMIRRLLEQGINFWLAHSLPLSCLETLLIKHMSKFFYPLGLMLFCDWNVDSEEDVGMSRNISGDEKRTSRTPPGSILSQLSTRFCLQLCSTLLSHIRHKKVAYPEYVELLAQVMAMQSPFTKDNGGGPPSSTGTQGPILSADVPYTPEHAMEAVLENLGLVGNGMESVVNPSPIHVDGDTVLGLLEDKKSGGNEEGKEGTVGSSASSRKSEQIGGDAVVFSCGHHFRADRFQQNVLPETELALLGLHHPLPHTARLVRGLFSAAVAPKQASSTLPPTLQLACPNCVLSHLQAQV